MKSCSLVFNCNNKYSHSQNQTLTAAFYIAYFPLWIMIPLGSLVRWVGLLSHHERTTPESVCNRPKTLCLIGALLVRTRVCDCCSHTCPNEPHQEGQRTRVWFNRTKWGRCESTLKICALYVFWLRIDYESFEAQVACVRLHFYFLSQSNNIILDVTCFCCSVKFLIETCEIYTSME